MCSVVAVERYREAKGGVFAKFVHRKRLSDGRYETITRQEYVKLLKLLVPAAAGKEKLPANLPEI